MTTFDLKRAKAHQRYRVNGSPVPGVTTVLGVIAKPALINWAWEQGMLGNDFRKVRDTSAEIGTLAHSLIADELRGVTETPMDTFTTEQVVFAEHCLTAWRSWREGKVLHPALIEEQMVSERYRYGGTIDIYGRLGRANELIDLKTGGGIYDEYLAQLAAYRQLLIENGHTVKRARILRIGRTANEGWEERVITDFEPYWELFAGALAVYNAQQKIRRGR